MLSDLQLVYMVPRNSTQLLKINTTKFQVEREPVYVTAMLNELGWHSLSKRREDARLILFYKIINNLAKVPHEHILVKAYEGIPGGKTTTNLGTLG